MLNLWRAPNRDDIAPRLNEFLQDLPGPVALHLPGEDSRRTRVLVTLSHGNEPSGLEAVHWWLQNGLVPCTDVVVILGAVEAALTEPLFYHRHLPDQRDLNRCFCPPYDVDDQGRLAQSILQHIRELQPEAVVDMHNTSGSSPAFSVTVDDSPRHRALAANFVGQLIVTDLRLGSLMEQDCSCPVVTIEAGGSQDEASGGLAREGIRRYFTRQDLFAEPEGAFIFRHPLRLELAPDCRIDYADKPLPGRDLTLREDIDHFNFQRVAPDQMLGWLGGEGLSFLQVGRGKPGDAAEFFREEGGQFYPNMPIWLFMATTRPDIAASDCLFYFVCE